MLDDVGEPSWDGDGSSCRGSLGLSEAQVAADFGEGALDADDMLVGAVAVEVEGDEFADAAASVGGGDEEGPVSGVDGVGEVGDLVGGKEPLLGVLDAWQGDVVTRCVLM